MMEQEECSEQELSELSSKEKISSSKRKRSEKSKRFSDEQVKSLESIFGQETKLEPRKKIQLARDLGLQPRQVSIWFQNKRARWKSKQMEQEYRVLKDKFDYLNRQFESMKKENESLTDQINKLRNLLENSHSHGKQSSMKDSDEDGAERDSMKRNNVFELKQNHDRALYSDEDELGIEGPLEENHDKEEIQFLSISEHRSSFASADQQWCNLPSDELLDDPSGWWNL